MGVSVGAPCIDSLIPITGLIIELCRNQQVFAPFFRRTGQRNHALEFICGTPPLPRFTVSQRQLCRNRVNQFVVRESTPEVIQHIDGLVPGIGSDEQSSGIVFRIGPQS